MTYFFNFILANLNVIDIFLSLVILVSTFCFIRRLSNLETRIDYLEENIDTWGAEQLKHSTYIKTLKADVTSLENKITELQNQCMKFINHNTVVVNKFATIENKIESLETQNKDLQTPPCLTITDLNKPAVKKRRNGKISIKVPTV